MIPFWAVFTVGAIIFGVSLYTFFQLGYSTGRREEAAEHYRAARTETYWAKKDVEEMQYRLKKMLEGPKPKRKRR